MADPTRYGERLFGITTPDNEIHYVYADFLYFESGVLLALRESGDKIKHLNLAMPAGTWQNAFAASTIDRTPVAIIPVEDESDE